MKEGEVIVASQLAGEFIMPHDVSQKLVFIAGGIGVTPFRSMIADLITRREKRDVVMLYANRKAEDVAYKEVFDQAERELGIKTVYALSDEPNPVRGMYPGSLTSDLVMTAVPDYHERTFYISGPHAMVDAFQTTLRGMSIPPSRIKVDFFPGFA